MPYSVFRPHSQEVYFLKSLFKKRPPTAFFHYPEYTKRSKEFPENRIRKYNRDDLEYLSLAFKISDTTHIYNAVVNTLKTGGFQMIENTNLFNLLWTGYTKPENIRELNHY